MDVFKEAIETFRDSFALLHGNFLVLCLAITFWSVSSGLFMSYEGKYIEALGGSYFDIGTFYGVCMIIGAIAGIPAGYICDTFGRKKLTIIGNYTTAFVWFIIFLAPTWQSYFAAQFLLALAAFWTVTESIMVVDSLPSEKRGLGLAVYSTVPSLFSLSSPYIGGWLFDLYGVFGMKIALLSIAIADLMKATLYRSFLKETLKSKRWKSATFSFKELKNLVGRSFVETFGILKRMPKPLIALCILNIIYSFTGSLASPFFIFYATEVILLSMVDWGAISMVQRGISLILSFPGGRLVDKFGKKITIFFNCVFETLFILGFIYSHSYFQVLVLFVFNTVIGTLTMTAWLSIRADFTPQEKRGEVYSLFRILGAIPGFFGSILGGYIYTLDPALPFWIYVVLGSAATVFVFLFIKEAEKPEE